MVVSRTHRIHVLNVLEKYLYICLNFYGKCRVTTYSMHMDVSENSGTPKDSSHREPSALQGDHLAS